jgi:hypothetical protein
MENPQEEPKPHSFCETPKEKCTMNYCDENGCQNRVRHLVEPKQETLEEASSRYFKELSPDISFLKAVEFGAKWQAERMYSEEEVKQIIEATLIEYSDYVLADIPEWFKQFKKT